MIDLAQIHFTWPAYAPFTCAKFPTKWSISLLVHRFLNPYIRSA